MNISNNLKKQLGQITGTQEEIMKRQMLWAQAYASREKALEELRKDMAGWRESAGNNKKTLKGAKAMYSNCVIAYDKGAMRPLW